MKVYVVMYYYYEDTSVWGVFSSEELAQAAIDGTAASYRENLGIEEWELDTY